MDTSPAPVTVARELLTVDLRGLKSALLDRARSQNVSTSAFVRAALIDALGGSGAGAGCKTAGCAVRGADRVRIAMRLPREDAIELVTRARTAGLPIGAYVSSLMRSAVQPPSASDRAACTSSLTRSNAELAALSRNIGHLTTLLRQGSARAAQEYWQTLETLNAHVRAHLAVVAEVLTEHFPTRAARERTGVLR